MSTTNRELTNAFERYFSGRVQKARAITPGQKKELIERLRQELKEDGRVPLPTGPVKVDPKHAAIRAALDGRAVTMGGKIISQISDDSLSGRMEALPVPAKIGLMAAIFLIPLSIVILIMVSRGGEEAEGIVLQPTATATLEATKTPLPTITPLPNATVTATPVPTQPPIVIQISPTPYAFALTEGDAPNSNNDPASIEIAGFSYILGAGKVDNGAWQPAGAEWLRGSYLRRIIGLPYEPDIANVLTQIRAGNVIKLRLRSGEIVKYKIAQTLRVQRQQIEVLAERSPSLAIILYGEPSPERTVVIGKAVQEPQDFSVYSIGASNQNSPVIVNGTPQAPSVPTLVPVSQQTIITSTRTMTNTLARLTVEVESCNQADDIGGQKPPKSKQKYMVCNLTLSAAKDGLGTTYSQEALAITDQDQIDSSIDWKPPPVPQPSDALGNGSLNAGDQVSGRIAGIVETSDPVLVWQQAGTKIIIQLE